MFSSHSIDSKCSSSSKTISLRFRCCNTVQSTCMIRANIRTIWVFWCYFPIASDNIKNVVWCWWFISHDGEITTSFDFTPPIFRIKVVVKFSNLEVGNTRSFEKVDLKKILMINISELAKCLTSLCNYLTFIHAFEGCDTTSATFGVGKLVIIN